MSARINDDDLKKIRNGWSQELQQYLFWITDGVGNPVAAQGRNFDPSKPNLKYDTYGKLKDQMFMIIKDEPLILTEDILSALRVGRNFSSMPLFGSNISVELLNHLKLMYKKLVIWLDRDKSKEALKFVHRARAMGFESTLILSEYDPKYYDDEEIIMFVHRSGFMEPA